MPTNIMPKKDEAGNIINEVIPGPSQLTADLKIQKVSVYKAEGSSSTKVSHDWTDRCTWFCDSLQIVDEILTLESGKIYASSKPFWIDAIHGRIYGEDELTEDGTPLHFGGIRKYVPIVKDNGVVIIEDQDFIINYEDGKITLDDAYTPNGDIAVTFYHENGGTYYLIPKTGKKIIIEHAELQFSKDIQMVNPLNFEIWVYHPDQVTYPGIKILYQKTTYKNMRDVINAANLGQGYIPAMAGLQNDVIVFPFDYATLKPLSSLAGAELRISINGNTPLTGEWATVTFYVLSEAV